MLHRRTNKLQTNTYQVRKKQQIIKQELFIYLSINNNILKGLIIIKHIRFKNKNIPISMLLLPYLAQLFFKSFITTLINFLIRIDLFLINQFLIIIIYQITQLQYMLKKNQAKYHKHQNHTLGSAIKRNRTNAFQDSAIDNDQFITTLEEPVIKKAEKKVQIQQDKKIVQYFIGREQQNNRNKNILQEVLNSKLNKKQIKIIQKQEIKKEELIPQIIKQQSDKKKPNKSVNNNLNKQKQLFRSSNWNKFIQTNKNTNQVKSNNQYVAIDCQFVQSHTNTQQLARISIVGQNNQVLFESYVRPDTKIIDYRTSISGVTFGHIKNAPKWDDIRRKVQKILYNKKIVGHTIYKDLKVMKMQGWIGFKDVIDIAQFRMYKQKGKNQSLRKLSLVFLQRQIQNGIHSSLQDARATMDLFKLKKEKILQQLQRQRSIAKKMNMNEQKAKVQKQQVKLD